MLTFYDKFFIAILLSISFFFLVFLKCHSKGNTVNITVDGNEVIETDTNADKTFSVKGVLGITEVEIKDGQVRVIDSPCDNKTCVKAGWISRSYQTILCIPNHVVIEIIDNSKEIDAVTR